MTSRYLPGLHLLCAFEAAARLKSFKLAAEELTVTPSAVSQRIHKLEDLLGVTLFTRLNRAVVLTPTGTAYLREIGPVIANITDATERFVVPSGTVVVLAMNSIVAQEMVIPNLARFRDWEAGAEINIRTRPSMKTFLADVPAAEKIDAGIRLGTGPWPGFDHRVIGEFSLLPLCSPALAEQIRDWDDLHRQTLYCARSRRNETLEAMKHPVTGRFPKSVATFETQVEAVCAVETGLGVMCGMMPIMNNLVRQGRLSIAIEPEYPSSEMIAFLVPADHQTPDRLIRVGDWIVDCYRRLPPIRTSMVASDQ